ncbi:hypothetical protein TNCV_4806141 [Trichonephila clavipes]|nr:hypothetical protein TNCV_4806141 [Trichonephila clavipes]
MSPILLLPSQCSSTTPTLLTPHPSPGQNCRVSGLYLPIAKMLKIAPGLPNILDGLRPPTRMVIEKEDVVTM